MILILILPHMFRLVDVHVLGASNMHACSCKFVILLRHFEVHVLHYILIFVYSAIRHVSYMFMMYSSIDIFKKANITWIYQNPIIFLRISMVHLSDRNRYSFLPWNWILYTHDPHLHTRTTHHQYIGNSGMHSSIFKSWSSLISSRSISMLCGSEKSMICDWRKNIFCSSF